MQVQRGVDHLPFDSIMVDTFYWTRLTFPDTINVPSPEYERFEHPPIFGVEHLHKQACDSRCWKWGCSSCLYEHCRDPVMSQGVLERGIVWLSRATAENEDPGDDDPRRSESRKTTTAGGKRTTTAKKRNSDSNRWQKKNRGRRQRKLRSFEL